MSTAAGVSTAHHYRLFNEHVHETPIQVFTKSRINHAATLLAQTGLPIKEIFLRAGFEEPSYFSKVFKKIMSAAPGAYHARMQGMAGIVGR